MKSILMVLSISYLLIAQAVSASARSEDVAVVGYLPEWRYEGANYDVIATHVSHLLFFSLEVLPDGGIGALDRLPSAAILAEARIAADRHGTELLVCFGGNARSAGFSPMVRSDTARARFVANVLALIERLKLDGVDYNWEYPGYEFGRGYLAPSEVDADYAGLIALFRDTRAAFSAHAAESSSSSRNGRLTITMAYYPDGKQEALLHSLRTTEAVDLLHMMSYDQGGAHHSTTAFGKSAVDQGVATFGRDGAQHLTMGLPFYGRTAGTGEWTTYEDLVQTHHPLDADADALGKLSFNGLRTIGIKTEYAIEAGLGGVMIWEAGQDCRTIAVTRNGKTHGVTCPAGDDSSLLVAITRAIAKAGRRRARSAGWWSSRRSEGEKEEREAKAEL